MVEYGTQMRRENLVSERETFRGLKKYFEKFLKKFQKSIDKAT